MPSLIINALYIPFNERMNTFYGLGWLIARNMLTSHKNVINISDFNCSSPSKNISPRCIELLDFIDIMGFQKYLGKNTRKMGANMEKKTQRENHYTIERWDSQRRMADVEKDSMKYKGCPKITESSFEHKKVPWRGSAKRWEYTWVWAQAEPARHTIVDGTLSWGKHFDHSRELQYTKDWNAHATKYAERWCRKRQR